MSVYEVRTQYVGIEGADLEAEANRLREEGYRVVSVWPTAHTSRVFMMLEDQSEEAGEIRVGI